MAKVKIQTALASNFGYPVKFGDIELKFDKLGYAEVESQEVADKLVDLYDGWLFIDAAPKKKAADKSSEIAITELSDELDRAKQKVLDREATIEAVTQECTEWKAQVELYKKQAEEATTELEGYKTQSSKVISELELKVSLTTKTMPELTEICKQLEIPEERYKDVKKPELITIILDESRSK